MESILDIPEIRALQGGASLIRIPNQIDIPVTQRILRLIDTAPFQRLKRISQLGLVNQVYPAANHDRFEHSLGVYRNALLFLQQFATVSSFTAQIDRRQAEILILAALLHDIGHWPFCHPIEDMRLPGIASHEDFAQSYLSHSELTTYLQEDWDIAAEDVLAVIHRKRDSSANRILCSILSGPIDIDKMDYLYRDSLHAGVPYGQNFDALRLVRSLCLDRDGKQLAITEKGRTAAELMVVARYVMFSEVYWHHTVRAATAMFQRSFFEWHQLWPKEDLPGRLEHLFGLDERSMIDKMEADFLSKGSVSLGSSLLKDLFGSRRKLHKRIANYDMERNEQIYSSVAQQPYQWLVRCGEVLSRELQSVLGVEVADGAVLIDAPPVGLEVQFDVDVWDPASNTYRRLGDVSPLVKALAQRQFDDFVKQVRIFVAPELRAVIRRQFGDDCSAELDKHFVKAIELMSNEKI